MGNQQRWEDLGRSIQNAVDGAVGSRNYDHLNQTIRQAVETAVDLGGDAVRKAARTVQSQPQVNMPPVYMQPEQVRALYGKTGGKVVGSILKTMFGGCITPFFGLAMLGFLVAGGELPAMVITAAMLAGGGWLLFSGIKTLNLVSRFRAYRRVLGNRTQCSLEKLARVVGKSVPFVRDDIRKMIANGFFLEGHMDYEGNNLITSEATYRHFEQARFQLEQARQQQAIEAANAPDPRIREVLDKGSDFVAQIRKCNDDIPGEEISAKISHMELIVQRIFDRAREHPEVIPDLKKMMDYYLPMTVKLLNAYADMDAQPIRGGTIESSKREIEGSLDTLNRAFEKLLDELFQDTAMDVSSDISVLHTMLAQEGLTDDELTKLRRQNNQ